MVFPNARLEEKINDLIAGTIYRRDLVGKIKVDVPLGELSAPFDEARDEHGVDAPHGWYGNEQSEIGLHTLSG